MTGTFGRRMAALLCVLLPLMVAVACENDDKKPENGAGRQAGANAGVVALPRDGGGGENVCPIASQVVPDRWFYTARLTQASGLVLEDVRFGPRLVARSMSVPYVRVKVGDAVPVVALLTRTPAAGGTMPAELIGQVACAPEDRGEGATGVSATYRLTVPLPGDKTVPILVQQSFRFDTQLDSKCEPTMTARCRRFWPTTTWAIPGSWNTQPGDPNQIPDIAVSVVQRYEFDPDGASDAGWPGSTDLIRDTPRVGTNGLKPFVSVDDHGTNGRMVNSGSARVIIDGDVGTQWENWHQTGRGGLGLPGLIPGVGDQLPLHDHLHVPSGTAGCSECVHAHWSWFAGVRAYGEKSDKIPDTLFLDGINMSACGTPHCWSDGNPQILDGSKQTACIGWTTNEVTESRDWCTYPEAPLAADRPPVMYWDATSNARSQLKSGVSIGNQDYSVGDSYWPPIRTNEGGLSRKHGGNGSMFVVPARRLTGVAKNPGKDEAIITITRQEMTADGWETSIAVQPGDAHDQGPYYLRVHTGDDLKLVNGDRLWQGDGVGWVRITGAGGRPVMAYPGTPMPVKVVVNRQPRSGEVALALDASPDGISGYAPSFGLDWKLPLRNWRQPLWDALGCGKESIDETWFTPANVELDAADYADVTGDSVPDAIVAGSCPAITASWPKHVFVYDGTNPVAPLRLLLESGNDVLSLGVKVTTADRKVTITHNVLGPTDPRCCPGTQLTEVHEWRGDKFVKISSSRKPQTD